MNGNPLFTALKVTGFIGGSGLILGYLSDSRAWIHELVSMPLMHQLDPETSHKLSIWFAKNGICPRDSVSESSRLQLKMWGKTISNPIGLAAGYDKHGEAVDSLLNLGFGLVEIGSVTPQPQKGNPLPRFFRLPQDDAVINRYGFNSQGHEAVRQRLWDRIVKYQWWNGLLEPSTPKSLHADKLVGVNLGKNKTSAAESHLDYMEGIDKLGKFADYIVINISSPNTPGLRKLQARKPIEELLTMAKGKRDEMMRENGNVFVPLLVKIAPDCDKDQLSDIAAVVEGVGIDGVVISNTTISRPKSLLSEESLSKEAGGLSGKPVKPLALAAVSTFYELTGGRVPIIGCGGISSAKDCIDFAKAGASLVQIYTALGYKGPGLITTIKHDLGKYLELEGKQWSDLVGTDHQSNLISTNRIGDSSA